MHNNYYFMIAMPVFVAAQSEGKGSSSQRLVSSLSTLYLISKIKPQLLVKHAMTLQPYLSTKCSVSIGNLEVVIFIQWNPVNTDTKGT